VAPHSLCIQNAIVVATFSHSFSIKKPGSIHLLAPATGLGAQIHTFRLVKS
jgi:hypothetical protein